MYNSAETWEHFDTTAFKERTDQHSQFLRKPPQPTLHMLCPLGGLMQATLFHPVLGSARAPILVLPAALLDQGARKGHNEPLAANESSLPLHMCQKLFLTLQLKPERHESKDVQRDSGCQTLAVINPKKSGKSQSHILMIHNYCLDVGRREEDLCLGNCLLAPPELWTAETVADTLLKYSNLSWF